MYGDGAVCPNTFLSSFTPTMVLADDTSAYNCPQAATVKRKIEKVPRTHSSVHQPGKEQQVRNGSKQGV
jgi:hypothetical protein